MQLDLNTLVLFYEVVNAGSINSASERTGAPKSTISRKISEFEHRIGVRLLNRGRRLTLTDVGRRFYGYCEKISGQIDMATSLATRVRTGVRKSFRVSMPSDFGIDWFRPTMVDFAVRFPEVNLISHVNSHWVDIRQDPYDVAVHIGQRNRLRKIKLPQRLLAKLPRRVYASPEYLKRKGTPRRVADLFQHDCIVNNAQRDEGLWKVQREKGSKHEVPARVSVNSVSLSREMTVAGLGIAVLPELVCRNDVTAGRLKSVDMDWSISPLHATATFSPERQVPRHGRHFLDRLSDELTEDIAA